MAIRGIDAFLELLAAAGVRYIFGNPGTTELPLNDALVGDQRFQYILGLQEVPLMAMADGYAMASRKLGVVNVHICCGLGNAMGMLYNAFREGTPLLVTAGQQDRRLKFEEPILWGSMVEVARPWTKWAVEVERVEDLPSAMRRAIQVALTPPTGPVFMSIPVDVQMAACRRTRSDAAAIARSTACVRRWRRWSRAAEVLLGAKNPAILVGSRVQEADAVDELVRLAERLGVPVISESGTTHGRLAFPCDHPLYAQGLPLWSPEMRERLEEFDVLFVVGMDLLRQYVYSRTVAGNSRAHSPDSSRRRSVSARQKLSAGSRTDRRHQNRPDRIGSRRRPTNDAEQTQAAPRTRPRHMPTSTRPHRKSACANRCAAQRCRAPMSPLALMEAVARVLPPDVAVIEEAVTTTNTMLERLGAFKNTSGYFGHRGWALGWGLGVSIGVKLAWPDRPVLAILGEGAAMYGIQGLWSAAHHRVPVTFVICQQRPVSNPQSRRRRNETARAPKPASSKAWI